ncbi:ATP-binding cassette domain-containing protein [Nocardia sp. NBC_01503]|uniref:ATP-binding cassette domain-containing protein n=1 Tax=Nocardia sp. NBC_01503 TaxID=2975997 RepID=UPI002E7C420E|nr:ATP-binding cassette domain-containing protein [Nocardia sp. NBC_01503]WTL32582.1 ATP-binding cassette domain-containing protein [Nocardia sp. NBC_01503]
MNHDLRYRCPPGRRTGGGLHRADEGFGAGRGVFDLDLTVDRGETFGFIGPNGAGKTTTIRLRIDLPRPDRRHAKIFGLDAHTDSMEIKRKIGYLPGELVQWPRVSALLGDAAVAVRRDRPPLPPGGLLFLSALAAAGVILAATSATRARAIA